PRPGSAPLPGQPPVVDHPRHLRPRGAGHGAAHVRRAAGPGAAGRPCRQAEGAPAEHLHRLDPGVVRDPRRRRRCALVRPAVGGMAGVPWYGGGIHARPRGRPDDLLPRRVPVELAFAHAGGGLTGTGQPDDGRAPALEIVTIGDELLLGETVDHNSAWLGQVLAGIGIRVARRATVGDDAAAIKDAVAAALDRTGVALCTGGLGPTRDDLTKPAVAELFGRDLVLDEALLHELERRFAERGIRMAAVNRTQAEIPRGATVFPNPRGTAPGLALEDAAGRLAILLPGVPHEMRALMQEHVIPLLLSRIPERGRPVVHRRLRTTGIPEPTLAERGEDLIPTFAPLTVAFLPAATGVDMRLTSWGVLDAAEAARALDAAEAALRERVGRYIYGRDDEDLV